MTLGRNLNRLIDGGEGGLGIAIQSIGIGQVGQNTGFVFQAGSRSLNNIREPLEFGDS